MEDMLIFNVIANLEKWSSWEYKSYPLSKSEAETIIAFYDMFREQYDEQRRLEREN